jgi:hypothetical protein
MAAYPKWLRWPLRVIVRCLRAFRLLFALWVVVGIVSIAAAVVQRDAGLAIRGLGAALLGGIALGLNADHETVIEAVGPRGAFVTRTSRRRVWRDARGWQKVAKFVIGEDNWTVLVRRREEDPFGRPLLKRSAETQRLGIALAEDIARSVRAGRDPADVTGDAV